MDRCTVRTAPRRHRGYVMHDARCTKVDGMTHRVFRTVTMGMIQRGVWYTYDGVKCARALLKHDGVMKSKWLQVNRVVYGTRSIQVVVCEKRVARDVVDVKIKSHAGFGSEHVLVNTSHFHSLPRVDQQNNQHVVYVCSTIPGHPWPPSVLYRVNASGN